VVVRVQQVGCWRCVPLLDANLTHTCRKEKAYRISQQVAWQQVLAQQQQQQQQDMLHRSCVHAAMHSALQCSWYCWEALLPFSCCTVRH
jgi:hypothetical protein